jgi:hypothetical protein
MAPPHPAASPVSAWHPGTHPGPGRYPHDAPHPPPAGASKNRGTEIRGPSSTTSGGPHFCAHELEQTSASRVRPATPRLDRANKGASRRYPVARRRQLPTGLSFCRPRARPETSAPPTALEPRRRPTPRLRTGVCEGENLKARTRTSRAFFCARTPKRKRRPGLEDPGGAFRFWRPQKGGPPSARTSLMHSSREGARAGL